MTKDRMTGRNFDTLSWSSAGGVTTVVLNRPCSRNAMTTHMLQELHDLLRAVCAATAATSCLILTGAGDWFCPGADIDVQSGPGRDRPPAPELFDVPALLHDSSVVTIAAINGSCAGAGLAVALACDLRYTVPQAKFATAFLDVGVAGDMGIPWTLPRLVGPAVARELSFLNTKINGKQAARIGLVNGCVPREDLMRHVNAVAARIDAAPAAARTTLKQNYVDAERMTLASFVELETQRHLPLLADEESQRAFEARRRTGSGRA